jgi:hypothetical protein
VLLDFKWTSRRWSVPGYATARAVKNSLTSRNMSPESTFVSFSSPH